MARSCITCDHSIHRGSDLVCTETKRKVREVIRGVENNKRLDERCERIARGCVKYERDSRLVALEWRND